MPANSQILISSTTHDPTNSTPRTLTSEIAKGDGFYQFGQGIHTVEVQLTGFVGTINIQGTLAAMPTDMDWFTVSRSLQSSFTIDTTGLISNTVPATISYSSPTTGSYSYNFEGNLVWIRVIVTNWTAGTINKVLYNH